ncbi:hypothetical protein ON010_g18930 [Phytophthora cinnamomi]|nr:hypothetical protein ON010_g18930 [Phytophthora cinnamomi]
MQSRYGRLKLSACAASLRPTPTRSRLAKPLSAHLLEKLYTKYDCTIEAKHCNGDSPPKPKSPHKVCDLTGEPKEFMKSKPSSSRSTTKKKPASKNSKRALRDMSWADFSASLQLRPSTHTPDTQLARRASSALELSEDGARACGSAWTTSLGEALALPSCGDASWFQVRRRAGARARRPLGSPSHSSRAQEHLGRGQAQVGIARVGFREQGHVFHASAFTSDQAS